MAARNVSLFKGLLTVLIVSVIVFFTIFFFFPDTSFKYFGTAFDSQKAVEDTFAALLYKADYMTEEEAEKVGEYLSSADGKAFIKNISAAVKGGAGEIESFLSSESFKNFQSAMSGALSRESLSKLQDALDSTASTLYDTFN